MSVSFQIGGFMQYYIIVMCCLMALCFVGMGIVIYLDREKFLGRKDRRYMYELFKLRPKAATILFSMAAIYFFMFFGLFFYVASSSR